MLGATLSGFKVRAYRSARDCKSLFKKSIKRDKARSQWGMCLISGSLNSRPGRILPEGGGGYCVG